MNRDTLIDVAKGVGILLVVFAHTYEGYSNRIIYFFHMPLFFLLSGCALTYSRSAGIKWRSLLRGLAVPYLTFSLLTFAYWVLIENKFRPFHDGEVIPCLAGVLDFKWQQFVNIFTAIDSEDAFIYDVVMWFLPALFVCRVLFGVVPTGKYRWFAVLAVALAGQGLVCWLGWNLPWCMEIAFVAFPFLVLGYEAYGCYKRRVNARTAIGLVAVGCIVLFLIGRLTDVSIGMHSHRINGAWIYVTGVTGSLLTLSLCWLLELAKLSKPLQFLGKNSLAIMCLHEPLKRIVIKAASSITNTDTESVRQDFILCVLIALVVVVALLPCICALNKWAPWMVGKRA